MDDLTIEFLVVPDLFKRYTIIVNPVTSTTSVYCDDCEQWVSTYSGNQIVTLSANDFLEKIVADHTKHIFGERVVFDDSIESFI